MGNLMDQCCSSKKGERVNEDENEKPIPSEAELHKLQGERMMRMKRDAERQEKEDEEKEHDIYDTNTIISKKLMKQF